MIENKRVNIQKEVNLPGITIKCKNSINMNHLCNIATNYLRALTSISNTTEKAANNLINNVRKRTLHLVNQM